MYSQNWFFIDVQIAAKYNFNLSIFFQSSESENCNATFKDTTEAAIDERPLSSGKGTANAS